MSASIPGKEKARHNLQGMTRRKINNTGKRKSSVEQTKYWKGKNKKNQDKKNQEEVVLKAETQKVHDCYRCGKPGDIKKFVVFDNYLSLSHQMNANPSRCCYRILRYLSGTSSFGLVYKVDV